MTPGEHRLADNDDPAPARSIVDPTDAEALQEIPVWLADALERLGIEGTESLRFVALTGGVSSEVGFVVGGSTMLCAKRARARLAVEQEWYAPTVRARFEARWLQLSAELVPGFSPALVGFDEESGTVLMEALDPGRHSVWKSMLLDGDVGVGIAARLGAKLGEFHRAAGADLSRAAHFPTDELFESLRVDPYLRATAARHPDCAGRIEDICVDLFRNASTVVHGDVSPKNVLVDATGQPRLLDAECAWWGDPSFDIAFLVNHLLLKQLVVTDRAALGGASLAFLQAYGSRFSESDVFRRAARLLPVLMLARVDGKSPVEYLDEERQATVREFARAKVLSPRVTDLAGLIAEWGRAVG